MQEKAVSIIIPCYNMERYLPRCVSSLLNQTIGLERLELIFVDDASTDGTLDHLYQLEHQYPEEVMVVTYPENQGQGAARNIGMGYATGRYIGFVDADDQVLPQMYEEMYQKAEETGCELVGSHISRSTDGRLCARGRIRDAAYDQVFCVQDDRQRRELLAGGMGIFGTLNVTSKIYLRSFLEKYRLRFGEGYYLEDLYFSDMISFYIHRFCVMQAEYYQYHIHPSSTMTSMKLVKWSEQKKIMQVWLEECIDRGLLETYYYEIELMFGRDHYLSDLHYIFTRGKGDREEEAIVQKSQMIMKALFPNIAQNPYILREGEDYIRDCQKDLFAYVAKGFSPGDVQKAREEYLQKAMDLVQKEKAEEKTEKETGREELIEKPKITVMLAADKAYLYPAMILITSLFQNHRKQEVTVYLLHYGCDARDLEEISLFAGRWPDKEICCIQVPAERLASLKAFGRFSVATFFRILGIVLIPREVERVLYLDVDMVVNKSLSALFLREMKKPLAACYDVNNYLQGNIERHREALGIPVGYGYFNAGMLLMDLGYMREEHVAERLLADIEKHFDAYSLVDQDALNRYFYEDVEILPWQVYNCPCIPFLSRQPEERKGGSLITYPELYSQKGEFQIYDITGTLMENASIIHFCTSQKPWRDRDFYSQDNMRSAMRIYEQYETIYRALKI